MQRLICVHPRRKLSFVSFVVNLSGAAGTDNYGTGKSSIGRYDVVAARWIKEKRSSAASASPPRLPSERLPLHSAGGWNFNFTTEAQRHGEKQNQKINRGGAETPRKAKALKADGWVLRTTYFSPLALFAVPPWRLGCRGQAAGHVERIVPLPGNPVSKSARNRHAGIVQPLPGFRDPRKTRCPRMKYCCWLERESAPGGCWAAPDWSCSILCFAPDAIPVPVVHVAPPLESHSIRRALPGHRSPGSLQFPSHQACSPCREVWPRR